MTTQVIFNAQAFGTSTNKGNGLFSISPLTLADATTSFIVNLAVTLGADQSLSKTTKIRVWYTTTIATVAAGDAVSKLGQTANFVDAVLDRPIVIVDSLLEPKTGNKFHAWADAPTLSVAAAITATLVELPS